MPPAMMAAGSMALAGVGTVAGVCALFVMGASDAAVIAAIGPVALSLPFAAVFELMGASLAGQNIAHSLPNRVSESIAVEDSVGCGLLSTALLTSADN